jgi:hypothetical protein
MKKSKKSFFKIRCFDQDIVRFDIIRYFLIRKYRLTYSILIQSNIKQSAPDLVAEQNFWSDQ